MAKSDAGGSDDGRLGFVDDARGLAVVLMIFWHTVDGWIRRDLHVAHPQVLDVFRVFGGTAAPMFVMLAGVGAAMKLYGDHLRAKAPWISSRELAARGMHVITMGYALRVYTWTIDDRAILKLSLAPATLPLLLGLGCLLVGFERLAAWKRESLPLVVLGAAAYCWGVSQAFVLEPHKAPHLLKVDVLQAIGVSLVLIALLDPLIALSRRPWLAILLGVLVALPTSYVAARMPGGLPPAIAAYLGTWNTPLGTRVAAFPIFPWVGYAFTGVAIGYAWMRAAAARKSGYVVVALGAFAAGISAIANGPPMHRWVIPHFPDAYKAMFMLHKVGFALALLIVLTLLCDLAKRYPLRDLGKTSMIIYWVHLEFAYGLLARPIKHQLSYGQWAIGFAALTLSMAAIAHVRLRFPAWSAARRAAKLEGATRSS